MSRVNNYHTHDEEDLETHISSDDMEKVLNEHEDFDELDQDDLETLFEDEMFDSPLDFDSEFDEDAAFIQEDDEE